MAKVVQGLEEWSQDAVSLRDRDEFVAAWRQLTAASHWHQEARPAGRRTACVVTASASDVQMTSAAAVFAAAAVADRTGSESASVERRHRAE